VRRGDHFERSSWSNSEDFFIDEEDKISLLVQKVVLTAQEGIHILKTKNFVSCNVQTFEIEASICLKTQFLRFPR